MQPQRRQKALTNISLVRLESLLPAASAAAKGIDEYLSK